MRTEVKMMLIESFAILGMDTPENIEGILNFVMNDLNEAADPDFNDSDVVIALRRWIEGQGGVTIRDLLPVMIPHELIVEVLERWKSRAHEQGYPKPKPDGTFGQATHKNKHTAELELTFFLGAICMYEALNGALETEKSAIPPVVWFAALRGQSIQHAIENRK